MSTRIIAPGQSKAHLLGSFVQNHTSLSGVGSIEGIIAGETHFGRSGRMLLWRGGAMPEPDGVGSRTEDGNSPEKNQGARSIIVGHTGAKKGAWRWRRMLLCPDMSIPGPGIP